MIVWQLVFFSYVDLAACLFNKSFSSYLYCIASATRFWDFLSKEHRFYRHLRHLNLYIWWFSWIILWIGKLNFAQLQWNHWTIIYSRFKLFRFKINKGVFNCVSVIRTNPVALVINALFLEKKKCEWQQEQRM